MRSSMIMTIFDIKTSLAVPGVSVFGLCRTYRYTSVKERRRAKSQKPKAMDSVTFFDHFLKNKLFKFYALTIPQYDSSAHTCVVCVFFLHLLFLVPVVRSV